MAQLNFTVGAIQSNVEKCLVAIAEAKEKHQADIIVFPELSITGYPPEDLLLRSRFYDRVQDGLNKLKLQVSGIDVVVGYPEKCAEGNYNAAAVIRDGEIIATYHKHQLPNYSVFDEKRYFLPGKSLTCFEVKGVSIGLTICEDIWEQQPALAYAEQQAQLLINLNASPFHMGKHSERHETLQQRVRETGLPVVYVNLVGGQDELVFDGNSFVMNYKGLIVNQATEFAEGLFPADFIIEADKLIAVESEFQPHDDELASIYNALMLGVKDYIQKNRFTGAVIGLSGGIDSALTLAIAVDAIGNKNVEAVMMPSQYTAQMSLEDAAAEAETLNIDYRVIPIEPIFNTFLDSLKGEFKGTEVDETEENIQARSRGVILMAISNKKGKMVLTTGNKSEMAVGYATLYGDMAGGFDVLKDVPKTLVFRLSEYRNRIQEVIPQRVIDRPPSAELAPDQLDQDSLPPYSVLDSILELYIEQDQCLEDIIEAGFDEQTVKMIITLVDRNEYKRRQAAPGVRITRRAFGRDRRYPITSGYNKT